MILPVIMAGGSGSRLWPLSRMLYPKQFISLTDERSMLQNTISRIQNIEHIAPSIICNEEHRFIVAEQLRQQNALHSGIILEPVGRNTAPAIALAALQATKSGGDPILLVLAADHVIQNQSAFEEAVAIATSYANKGKLVTFGIIPHKPETGYGYIQQGDAIDSHGAFEVAEFVEKPNLETAKSYLEKGNYLWNSGMFMFRASHYLEELGKYHPDILLYCQKAMNAATNDLDFIRPDEQLFSACPNDSIDYAVMEKTQDAAVVPMNAEWSDVGSFSSLWDVSNKDENGNVHHGDVITNETLNSYLYSQNKLIATVGVSDLVVVETKDAVLVAHKNKVQDVKNIVNELKDQNRSEYLQHREQYRPWGSHDEIACGDRFQVKHLVVKPGERTATQMHYHRAEHWVVVQGTALVTNGDKNYVLTENESTYVPIGSPHYIENPSLVDLHLIEVRSGSYLSDEDIVRIEEYKSE